MMMWERWEVSSVGVRRHLRTRRRREDRPATVSQKPAVREHEPGPCLQRDLGHRHHHLPPRSVPQVQWVSLSSPLQTCWSTPGRSALGWRRSRTCSVWPRRLWIQNYRIVGSLGEAMGNFLSTCERLLLVRMSTFQLRLSSHVWLTVEHLYLSLSGEHGEWYYYNTRSGTSQWDHPVDVWCRQMAAMHRQGKREAGQ